MEIKPKDAFYKGQELDSDKWVYGYFSKMYCGSCLIIDRKTFYTYSVKPESVEQYTGRLDDNENPIYAGDIQKVLTYVTAGGVANVADKWVCVVKWDNASLRYIWQEVEFGLIFSSIEVTNCETVGNIHDNPDLLKVENGN